MHRTVLPDCLRRTDQTVHIPLQFPTLRIVPCDRRLVDPDKVRRHKIVIGADPRLGPHENVIPELGAARNARLADQHASSTQGHVVPDLHQIINLRPGADHRVRPGPAVDGAVGPDLDTVPDNDPAELGHVEIALRVQREAEAPVADANAGMDMTVPADQAMAQGRVGADLGGFAHLHPVPDHRVGADPAIRPDIRAGADHHAGADLGTLADAGAGIDQRARVPAGPPRGRRIEGLRHQRIGAVGIGGDQRRHARGRLFGVPGLDDTGPRRAAPELLDIALVVEKADMRGPGPVQRRDVGDGHGGIGAATDLGTANLGKFLQAEWARAREESGIGHGVSSRAGPRAGRANGR